MAGFAGIVSAIRHREIGRWEHLDQILLRMLLTASGMATLFAMLPAVLAEARLPEPTIWRVASISLLVWQSAIAVHRSRQFRAAGRPSPLPRLLYLWMTVVLLLQAFNVVLAASWPYLLGILGILANAFSFFLVLLLGRNGEEQAVRSG